MAVTELDNLFIRRCFLLARLGEGHVSPNPMVGAVIVYQGNIIGEGFHQQYRKPHAEVNAIASVPPDKLHLLSQATLYVSLEPCCIQEHTPPCTDLILQHRFARVVVSCLDRTPQVSGNSIRLLRAAGIETDVGVLADEGEFFCRYRNHFVTQHRPYIILKWAQTANSYMGKSEAQQWISNAATQRLVHKWRSEVDTVMVGTQTAFLDNPALTNRYYFGKQPVRIVLDRYGRIPGTHRVFDSTAQTIVFTEKNILAKPNISIQQVSFDDALIKNILSYLYEQKIAVVMVEGGSNLLHQFIHSGYWDEARVITAAHTYWASGICAPVLTQAPKATYCVQDNYVQIFRNILS